MDPNFQYYIIAKLNAKKVKPNAYHLHYSSREISASIGSSTLRMFKENGAYTLHCDDSITTDVPEEEACAAMAEKIENLVATIN